MDRAGDYSLALSFVSASVECSVIISPTVINVNPRSRNLAMISGNASAVCHPLPLMCMTMMEPFFAIDVTYLTSLSFVNVGSGSPDARSNCTVLSPTSAAI